ncbi:MAG: class I SAM-dependent methyltransferase [Deltaproteobacteria bacterium]|nr:class I SAM-dependent methyltransferase [Deltaproteobacteria bacterium]
MTADRTSLTAALIDDARVVGVALAPGAVDKILDYVALLARWNPKVRLVGPDDPMTILREQVVDALGMVPAIAEAGCEVWLDVGAGGGLPGLVAAALLPDRHLILVEPIAKKTAFLMQVAIALDLRNITIHTGRAEPSGVAPALPARAPRPTGALSRATLAPPAWVALASALLGPGGTILIAAADTRDVPAPIMHDPATRRRDYTIPATGAPRLVLTHVVPALTEK